MSFSSFFSLDTVTHLSHASAGYAPLIVMLSVFFLGEVAILTAFGLAAQGYVPLWIVFAASFIAVMLADSFWFFAGRLILKFLHHFKFVEHYERGMGPIAAFLEKIVGKNIFLSLLFAKFLYGTRTLILVFLAVRKTSVWLFLLFSGLGTALFIALLYLVGWPLGRALPHVFPHHDPAALGLLILLVIVLITGFHYLLKKFVATELHDFENKEDPLTADQHVH